MEAEYEQYENEACVLKIAKQSKYDLVRSFVIHIHLLDDIVAKRQRVNNREKKKNGQHCFHLGFYIIDLCLPPFYLQSEQKQHWTTLNEMKNKTSITVHNRKWISKQANFFFACTEALIFCAKLFNLECWDCCLNGMAKVRYSYTIN